jgi:hypothetical protein
MHSKRGTIKKMGNIIYNGSTSPQANHTECCICKNQIGIYNTRLQCVHCKTFVHAKCDIIGTESNYSVCALCGRVGTLCMYKPYSKTEEVV